MTRDEILTMPAGSELDTLVDHHVMGGLDPCLEVLRRPYSTDVAAAWEVVEAMRRRPTPSQAVHKTWRVTVGDAVTPGWCCVLGTGTLEGRVSVTADTAPHAICLAALLAVLE